MAYMTKPNWDNAPDEAILFIPEDDQHWPCWYRYDKNKGFEYKRADLTREIPWTEETSRSDDEIIRLGIARPLPPKRMPDGYMQSLLDIASIKKTTSSSNTENDPENW